MCQRILASVGGSRTSTLGLQEAIRLVVDQRAQLRLISVIDESTVAQDRRAAAMPET